MPKKNILLSFLFLPLVVTNIQKNGTSVKNYIKTEATGNNAQVETNIRTNVNQTETTVRINQPGEVRVEVKNGDTKIETSKGITPTIIITGTSFEKPQVKIETQSILKNIFSPVRNIFRPFFDLFINRKKDLTNGVYLF